jgi:prophage regulatory protein
VTILKLPQVQAKTGLGKTRVYGLVKSGDFPKPVRLGKKAVGWLEHELDEWILARVRASRGETAEINAWIRRKIELRDNHGEALAPQGQG